MARKTDDRDAATKRELKTALIWMISLVVLFACLLIVAFIVLVLASTGLSGVGAP